MLELPRAKGEFVVPDEVIPPGVTIHLRPQEIRVPLYGFDPADMSAYMKWDVEMTQRLYDKYGGLRDFMRGRTGT